MLAEERTTLARDPEADDYRQLAALSDVSQQILAIRDEASLCERVPQLLAESLDFRLAFLNLAEGGRLMLRGCHVLDATAEQREQFLAGVRAEDHPPPRDIRRCFDSARTIVSSPDGWPKAFGWPNAILLTPLRTGDHVAGVLVACIRAGGRELLQHDVLRFEALANMVSLALANLRAYATLEQRVRERTLELARAQAELVQKEKMAALGVLVAGLCHELNTPVGALASSADTLTKATGKLEGLLGDVHDAKVSRTLGAVRIAASGAGRAAELVSAIVSRLRSFARLDQADRQLADVHDALEDVLSVSRRELGDRGVTRDFADVPPMVCNPRLLNQLFHNLVQNAIDATERRGRIVLRTRYDGARISVQVEDDGVGVSAAALPRIFDPGFTTKGVGVGAGLGLSICFEIARAHGGTIVVDSAPGLGARFTVALPCSD